MDLVDKAESLLMQGGHVHLIGIGGIGMAGLAWLLEERGFLVTGCDLQKNNQTTWLSNKHIEIDSEHTELHIDSSVNWLIHSTAVSDEHPELLRAKELGIPVSRRGEVLPALMRSRTCIAVSGTHGKTTTTAMIAQILDCGYFIGGEVEGYDGVARDAEIMVVEADESDGTVAGYKPDYAVITNVDYDHMEHHSSEAAFISCFKRFIENTKKTVFYCAEDSIASELCDGNPKCVAYSLPNPRLIVRLPGLHNQLNAAAALSVCRIWMEEHAIVERLKNIQSIKRRFETVYDKGGIRVISDYAHHPTEISALIQTARELNPKRLLGLFQPHRYTRTYALGKQFPVSFEGLDQLYLVPVYAASESPIKGGTSADLAGHFPDTWSEHLTNFSSIEHAWEHIRPELREGDVLLIIGAGDIEKVKQRL